MGTTPFPEMVNRGRGGDLQRDRRELSIWDILFEMCGSCPSGDAQGQMATNYLRLGNEDSTGDMDLGSS